MVETEVTECALGDKRFHERTHVGTAFLLFRRAFSGRKVVFAVVPGGAHSRKQSNSRTWPHEINRRYALLAGLCVAKKRGKEGQSRAFRPSDGHDTPKAHFQKFR